MDCGALRKKKVDGQWLRSFAASPLARALGVSHWTVRRWQLGHAWMTTEEAADALAHVLPDCGGSLPMYSIDMAIDGNTRVGGVGDYSLRVARGEHEILEPLPSISWEDMERLEDELCH